MQTAIIPNDLKTRKQWVVWKLEERNGNITKVPYCHRLGRKAKSTVPSDWCSFEEAQAAMATGRYTGIGFVFAEGGGIVGIDLDDCRDTDTGVIQPWATKIIRDLNSFTEISPSGRGIHIFVFGGLPPGRRRKDQIEIYDMGRYFTMTGEHLEGTPEEIEERSEALAALYRATFPKQTAQKTLPQQVQPILLNDQEVLVKAFGASNGAKIQSLYRGDIAGYSSQSEADYALVSHLAFWCRRDEEQIDRLFRSSALMRDKWDRSVGGETTYGQKTIDNAVATTAEIYEPTRVRMPKPEAPEPAAEESGAEAPEKGNDGKRHPNKIAAEILEKHKVISWGKDSVWEYDGTVWQPISPETVQQWALEAEPAWATRRSRRTEIANFVLIKSRKERIPWRSMEEYEVPVANGVIDIRNGKVRPHRPEDYLESVMPVKYEPGSPCTVLPTALRTCWREDKDVDTKIVALQEFFGYVLMPHAKYKRALLLYGEPDSGKSQILMLLQGMVGRDNYCSIPVKDMDDPKLLSPIKGKMLNSLGDLSQSALIADGGFKTLVSTGDAIQINAKYEKQETYVPFAKHVIATNNLPRINDLSNATFNRLLLLKFNRSIPREEQDVDLLKKMLAEAPGVLNWALAGARRLYSNRGEFTKVPESSEAVQEYKQQNNSVNDFIHLHCRPCDGGMIDLDDFRSRLNVWRKKDTLSLGAIRRMVKSALGVKACDNWTLFDYAWK